MSIGAAPLTSIDTVGPALSGWLKAATKTGDTLVLDVAEGVDAKVVRGLVNQNVSVLSGPGDNLSQVVPMTSWKLLVEQGGKPIARGPVGEAGPADVKRALEQLTAKAGWVEERTDEFLVHADDWTTAETLDTLFHGNSVGGTTVGATSSAPATTAMRTAV